MSQYISNTFAKMSLGQAIDEIVRICLTRVLPILVYVFRIEGLIAQCLFVQKNSPSEWNRRIKDAMQKDFSWDSECADVHISAYTALKNI